MDEYIKSFVDENDLSFNDFFDQHRVNILYKRQDYINLKNRKHEIYDKYPEIMHLIEDNTPMTFDNERVEAFCELQTILSMIDKLELKEAYKMGAKDSYIYMQSMDMLKI